MFLSLFKIVDGCWDIQPLGYALLIIIFLALFVAISIFNSKQNKKQLFNPKQLVFAGVCMALAFITSNIKFVKLPAGGSFTLFSMLFVTLIGYMYGLKIGLASAVAYGLLQLLVDPYVIGLPQLFVDYILAFGALGLSGVFANQKHGIIKGYLLGVLGRYCFAVLSGYIFFAKDASDHMASLLYSLSYNATYIVPEAILTLIILFVPAVSNALSQVKRSALE